MTIDFSYFLLNEITLVKTNLLLLKFCHFRHTYLQQRCVHHINIVHGFLKYKPAENRQLDSTSSQTTIEKTIEMDCTIKPSFNYIEWPCLY